MNPALNLPGSYPVSQAPGMIPMIPGIPFIPEGPSFMTPVPTSSLSHTRSRSHSRSRSYHRHSHYSHHHGRSRSRSRSRSRHRSHSRHHHRHHSRSSSSHSRSRSPSSSSASSPSRSPSSHRSHRSGRNYNADRRKERHHGHSPEAVLPDGTKVLFVGGLSPDVTQEDLRTAFGVHGIVDKVELKESFAYVYMKTGGTEAHKELNGSRLGASHRRIRVEWARFVAHGQSGPTSPNKTLYVADYDPRTTPDELRALFEVFGKVVRVSPCKKFTFIEFENLEDSIRAISEMRNKTVGTRSLTVQYALPEPRRKPSSFSPVDTTQSDTTLQPSSTEFSIPTSEVPPVPAPAPVPVPDTNTMTA